MTNIVSKVELLCEGSDEAFLQLLHRIFRLRKLLEVLREGNAKGVGLEGLEYAVLNGIDRGSRRRVVGVQDVADTLHMTSAHTSVIVSKLVKQGLVTKTTLNVDRRRVSLKPTLQGRAALDRIASLDQKVLDVAFGSLSGDEFRALADMLARLVAGGEKAIFLQRYQTDADSGREKPR